MDIVKRRRTRDKTGKPERWSETMSPEAKIAMQLAIEDTKALKLEEEKNRKLQDPKANEQSRSPTRVAFADDQKTSNNHNNKTTKRAENKDTSNRNPNNNQANFSELYTRNGSARMRRDLTDEDYSESSDPKKALGGGKVESAMEIVEIVNRDETVDSIVLDEHAIEELARINSVDKCTVWIEATQAHQGGSSDETSEASHQETPDNKLSPPEPSDNKQKNES